MYRHIYQQKRCDWYDNTICYVKFCTPVSTAILKCFCRRHFNIFLIKCFYHFFYDDYSIYNSTHLILSEVNKRPPSKLSCRYSITTEVTRRHVKWLPHNKVLHEVSARGIAVVMSQNQGRYNNIESKVNWRSYFTLILFKNLAAHVLYRIVLIQDWWIMSRMGGWRYPPSRHEYDGYKLLSYRTVINIFIGFWSKNYVQRGHKFGKAILLIKNRC